MAPVRLPMPPEVSRRVPVPPWARALAAVLVGAEVLGYALRVAGAPRAISHPLSMEMPFSAPRLLVACVFCAAAVAASTGAVRLRQRRAWWGAVAAVCAAIAVVKAGSTIHRWALQAIGGYEHPLRALVWSTVVVLPALAWLYWLSRDERRDRRRVLEWLAAYAVAAGGVSVVSGMVESAFGHASALTATAALVEEGSEALASVGVLVAVLVGVAPRLVFPPDHPFRRSADRADTAGGSAVGSVTAAAVGAGGDRTG